MYYRYLVDVGVNQGNRYLKSPGFFLQWHLWHLWHLYYYSGNVIPVSLPPIKPVHSRLIRKEICANETMFDKITFKELTS